MFEQYEQYLRSENKSINTIAGYLRAAKDYLTWFRDTYGREPAKLLKQNINEYKSFLQNVKHQDAKTINYKLSSLKKYNEFLVAAGFQKKVVLNKSMMLKVQQEFASPAVITEKDVNKLRQAVLEHGSSRDFALITLLAYIGIRISEARWIVITLARLSNWLSVMARAISRGPCTLTTRLLPV